MAEAPARGGFGRGFGDRGRGDRGRGDRGRGRGRGRKDEEEKWVPCTKLGRLVQQVGVGVCVVLGGGMEGWRGALKEERHTGKHTQSLARGAGHRSRRVLHPQPHSTVAAASAGDVPEHAAAA